MKVQVGVIKTEGTNCDAEAVYAFQKVGAHAEIVLMEQLSRIPELLHKYTILVLPGGFSYGDDIASGKIFAVEMLSFLKQELELFVARGNLIIGICNGFQILVKSGLLPFKQLGNQEATLTDNKSGRFECRWVDMNIKKSPCVFTQGLEGETISLPVAHAEGNFITSDSNLVQLEKDLLVPLNYRDHDGNATDIFPENPNGSKHGVAGICDKTGRIFGLMPHPERYIEKHQHPNWRSLSTSTPQGLALFEKGVTFAQSL